MVAKNYYKEEKPHLVGEELLNSLRKNDTMKELEFNIQNIINQKEATENQALLREYKDNKIRINTRTDAEKV